MTLTPEMKADGWSPHDGGRQPVGDTTECAVIYRDGSTFQGLLCAQDWDHFPTDHNCDIIAYRPV